MTYQLAVQFLLSSWLSV